MADPELEAIRRARLKELQAQHVGSLHTIEFIDIRLRSCHEVHKACATSKEQSIVESR